MKTRLSQILQSEQLSPARFADILGVQRSGISHILSGRNKPGFDLIEKIITKFPEIDAEWLITGKGTMYKHDTAPIPPLFPEQKLEEPPPYATVPPPSLEKIADTPRDISKIIILYSDRSFGEYHPE